MASEKRRKIHRRPRRGMEPLARFFDDVLMKGGPPESFEEFTEKCWEWIGTKNGNHVTPRFEIEGRSASAYQWIYAQLYPEAVNDQFRLLPSCLDMDCVNPFHLQQVARRYGGRKRSEPYQIEHPDSYPRHMLLWTVWKALHERKLETIRQRSLPEYSATYEEPEAEEEGRVEGESGDRG